jgi:hypothetical protein
VSWTSSADPATVKAAYLAQLADSSPSASDDAGVTTITFTGSSGQGTITLAPADGGGTLVYLELHH